MIKSSGYRISPTEVESVLLEAGAVREAAVIGVAHPVLGQSIKAIVSLRDGTSVGVDDLLAFCAERMPRYMVPAVVEIVAALPQNRPRQDRLPAAAARERCGMTHAETLIARWFGQAGGELLVGGRGVREIVAEVGTPSFVYDLDVLERKWKLLRAALPDRFEVYYSVKANPNPAIVQFLVERCAGLEVASAGEMRRALQAGCPPQRILFAGPGKTDAELDLAIEHGVGRDPSRVVARGRARSRRSRVAGTRS